MGLLLDPPISTKVRKMRSRVRWGTRQILDQGIDQTRLSITDGLAETPAFSFVVIGDSGFGPQPHDHPQREVAEYLATQMKDCRFLLHTGDVVYQMGAPEQYPANFIAPYREWLMGGDCPEALSYRNLVFQKPFLAVPGNHDYYNLPFPYGFMVAMVQPLRKFLEIPVTTNVSLRGSASGDTYAQAFLDYLKDVPNGQLAKYLKQHYTTETETGRSLTYQPGQFTRLPNRYYQFRYGGIDFFGLDSSTFNRPVEVDGAKVLEADKPNSYLPKDLDWQQLFWLRDRLIASCNHSQVRGRILYFHHPPYVTEVTKVNERACLSSRRHLRWVLDAVVKRLGLDATQSPVDLVLNGHAHCFEYLRTMDTGHADSHMDWLICGGSGARLRSQAGSTVHEEVGVDKRVIAKSQIFLGRQSAALETRWSYSFVKIDVLDAQGGDRPRFVVRPFIAEKYQGKWQRSKFTPLMLF
ncbi:MAG: metallophosphoesterase [Leptolyngbya sp. SIO1D8]|nr:metallophosphoesterase [Leptolyngbya sp. SIO1D8]